VRSGDAAPLLPNRAKSKPDCMTGDALGLAGWLLEAENALLINGCL
jgi:hypothetical protein